MDQRLAVYLPTPTLLAQAAIASGSGIVGPEEADAVGRILIDYEGNLYGASNLVRFADRVAHAAGRHVERYPTTARAYVSQEDLVRVGSWDATEGLVILVSSSAAETLAAWLGCETLDPTELEATGARYEQRRSVREALASGDPKRIATARFYARQHHIDIT